MRKEAPRQSKTHNMAVVDDIIVQFTASYYIRNIVFTYIYGHNEETRQLPSPSVTTPLRKAQTTA